ncbi:MAG: hypothetical protein M1833_001228 [Piccolia ochrophora]|nr:MAG: hypothetical protein M1833_001228 [Piccolia ochrophora]
MGIPHLTAHLSRYATHEVIKRGDVFTQGSRGRAIFDGPSLAHYVFTVLYGLKMRSNRCSITYEDLGRAVIEYLEALEEYGFIIDRIYFDGGLPEAKQGERIGRLGSCVGDVAAYRKLFDSGLRCSSNQVYGIHKGSVPMGFKKKTRTPDMTALPFPPFISPAAYEALSKSFKYANAVEVVPGEADAWCAARALEAGGTVFTDDSDLLVYSLGSNSSVVILRETKFMEEEEDDEADSQSSIVERATQLKYLNFRPSKIARALELDPEDGIAALAFEVTRSPQAAFGTLLQQAKARSAHGADDNKYQIFKQEYRLPDKASIETQIPLPLGQIMKMLDPRVSELVCQYSAHGALEDPSRFPYGSKVYLPYLIDDVARFPAWNIGSDVRAVAYSLLNFTGSESMKEVCVVEHRRRGRLIGSVEVASMTTEEVLTWLLRFLSAVNEAKQLFSGFQSKYAWWYIAVQQILLWHKDDGRRAPPRSVISGLLRGEPLLNWETVHIAAQFDAAMYSLRMLKQLGEVAAVVAESRPCEYKSELRGVVQEFQSLPLLNDHTPKSKDAVEAGDSGVEALIDAVLALIGKKPDAEVETHVKMDPDVKVEPGVMAEAEIKAEPGITAELDMKVEPDSMVEPSVKAKGKRKPTKDMPQSIRHSKKAAKKAARAAKRAAKNVRQRADGTMKKNRPPRDERMRIAQAKGECMKQGEGKKRRPLRSAKAMATQARMSNVAELPDFGALSMST